MTFLSELKTFKRITDKEITAFRCFFAEKILNKYNLLDTPGYFDFCGDVIFVKYLLKKRFFVEILLNFMYIINTRIRLITIF